MFLSGYFIFDIYGVERIALNGDYSADSLADTFIDNWIPYFECHKCGRWDYCKYAQPYPENPHRSVDIKCGVARDSIKNFVKSTFPVLKELDSNRVQEYLDGAFYFFKFIYDAEQYIGICMDPGFSEYFGEHAPMIFGNFRRLRNMLNELGSSWKGIPEFRINCPVLFVEGLSEKRFLDEMRKSHSIWFLDLNVEVYGGKGNRRSKRIQMLLDKYIDLGYEIYAQGDADGENTDIFRHLIKSGSVKAENTFVFKHDFETSMPLKLLYISLRNMKILNKVSEQDFIAALNGNNISILQKLRDRLGLDIRSHKLKLATTTARILSNYWFENPWFNWWQDDKFMNDTELGRFLRFIQRII